jgi:hypothetical protein
MDPELEDQVRELLTVQSPEKVRRGAPTHRAPATVKTYMRQLRAVYKAGKFGSETMQDLDWIENHEKVIATIEGLTGHDKKPLMPLTKSNHANPFAILAGRSAQEAYSEYIQKQKPSEEELDRSMQKKTPKERANWITWADLLKKRSELDQQIIEDTVPKFLRKERLDRHDKRLVTDHLILSLYTMTPGPLRSEFAEMVFFMPESKDEFVKLKPGDTNVCELNEDPEKCFFHIGRHKTLGKDGVRILHIPDVLVNVILRSFNLIPRKNLILRRHYLEFRDAPISNLTVVLNDLGQRHFDGRKLSCTLLRHISHTEESPKLISRGEMRLKAQNMGHSVRTANEIYDRRYDSL